MRTLLVTAIFLGLSACFVGCDAQMAGLRFAPGEADKATAQLAEDLAQYAATTGLPPNSSASRQLYRGAAIASGYFGSPRSPIDPAPYVPAAVTGAWATKDRQVEAAKLKVQVASKVGEISTRQIAGLVAGLTNKTIKSGESLQRAIAIAAVNQAGTEIASSIPIPSDTVMTAAEQKQLEATETVIAKLNEVAAASAAARPTLGDVGDNAVAAVEKASEKAQDWLGQISTVAEQWGIPIGGALGALGVGGVLVKRGRTAVAAKQAEADEAWNAIKVAANPPQADPNVAALVGVVKDLLASKTVLPAQA